LEYVWRICNTPVILIGVLIPLKADGADSGCVSIQSNGILAHV
jgi:hypothetical protein